MQSCGDSLMFRTILTLIDFGYWAAIAGAGAAVIALAAISPWGRLFPRAARVLAGFAGVTIASFAIGHLHGAYGMSNARSKLAGLQHEIKVARDREREQSADAQARLLQLQSLQTTVDSFEKELANGSTATCASDPVYDRRLRSILDGASK